MYIMVGIMETNDYQKVDRERTAHILLILQINRFTDSHARWKKGIEERTQMEQDI